MPSTLLKLPLEIRDEIYSFLFEDGSTILGSFPPCSAASTNISAANRPVDTIDLKLRRCPRLPLSSANSATLEYDSDDLIWLLTCKQIFSEGREAFTRTSDLEWLFDAGKLTPKGDDALAWTTFLVMPIAQPICLRINLAPEHFKTFFKNHYYELQPYGDLRYFLQFLQSYNIHMQRLRICTHAEGDDHKFRERRFGQVKRQFMLYLLDAFRELEAEIWQFVFGESSYGQHRGDLFQWEGSRDRQGRAVNIWTRGPY